MGSTIIVPCWKPPTHYAGLRHCDELSRIAYMGGATSRGGDLARSGLPVHTEGDETLYLRSKALIDVRAANVTNPSAGVGQLEDLDGLRTFARATRNLGYEGMMASIPHICRSSTKHSRLRRRTRGMAGIVTPPWRCRTRRPRAIRLNGRLIDVAHVHPHAGPGTGTSASASSTTRYLREVRSAARRR